MELALVRSRVYRLVKHTFVKYFNNFVQSAANACRQGDENPKSSVCSRNNEIICQQFLGLPKYSTKKTE